MSTAILATKLYIPPPRSKIVLRSRLIERLNEGMHCKLTLISPPTARADNLAPPRTGLRGLLLTQELDCCGHDHAD